MGRDDDRHYPQWTRHTELTQFRLFRLLRRRRSPRGRPEAGAPEPTSPTDPPTGSLQRLPSAALFDMDGLLIDSEPLWTVAEREIAAELGGEFSPAIKAAMIGQALPVAVPILLERLGTPASSAADPEDVGRRLLARVAELFATDLPLQPGALELLDRVREAGIRTGLVSSSYRLLVDTALVALGAERFDVTVAGDEVAASKPAPEPYLAAAAHLGVDPGRCVVLEDSDAGMRSALAAGCGCILVPTFPAGAVPAGVQVHSTLEALDLMGLAAGLPPLAG